MSPVMIVDDEPSLRRAVEIVLRHQHWEVISVPSGEECLARLAGGFKGVILMDIMMPGLTGWDTIREAAARGLLDGSLICMLTARATPGPDAAGLEEYVFDYLPKPFTNTELVRLVSGAAECLPS